MHQHDMFKSKSNIAVYIIEFITRFPFEVVGFFCGSTVAAMREIQSVKSPLDTKKSWDVTRIVSFFQHFKIAHLVDRICVCANMLRRM